MFTFYLHLISQIFFISILLTSASDKLCMLKITIIFRKVRSFHHATVCSRNHHNDTGYYIRASHSWCIRVCIFAIVAQLIMIFGFQLPPGSAPVTAVLIILSIGIAGGTLQATGGIDYLVFLASKIIERFPKSIIFIAPMIVFLFVFGVGTANIALSLEPIIAKTAVRANIQPKRPLTASVLTANLALLCSPAASATAYIISVMAGYHISMGQYLSIVLPTAIITMLMLSVFCTFVGRKTTVTASEIAHTPEVPVKQSFTTKTKLGVVGFYYVLQVY